MKEPGLASPHRVENDKFLFRRADVIYQYMCKKVIVELTDSDNCYVCFNGNKFTKFFDLPPPSLADYLDN